MARSGPVDLPFGETLRERPGFDAGPRGSWRPPIRRSGIRRTGATGRSPRRRADDSTSERPLRERKFALRVWNPDGGDNYVLASGDGMTWIESEQAIFGPQLALWPRLAELGLHRGSADHLGPAFGERLDWEPILDVNSLPPRTARRRGGDMESAITEAWLSTQGRRGRTNARMCCCAALPASVGVWISPDALLGTRAASRAGVRHRGRERWRSRCASRPTRARAGSRVLGPGSMKDRRFPSPEGEP